jgi:hypothetical protein
MLSCRGCPSILTRADKDDLDVKVWTDAVETITMKTSLELELELELELDAMD